MPSPERAPDPPVDVQELMKAVSELFLRLATDHVRPQDAAGAAAALRTLATVPEGEHSLAIARNTLELFDRIRVKDPLSQTVTPDTTKAIEAVLCRHGRSVVRKLAQTLDSVDVHAPEAKIVVAALAASDAGKAHLAAVVDQRLKELPAVATRQRWETIPPDPRKGPVAAASTIMMMPAEILTSDMRMRIVACLLGPLAAAADGHASAEDGRIKPHPVSRYFRALGDEFVVASTQIPAVSDLLVSVACNSKDPGVTRWRSVLGKCSEAVQEQFLTKLPTAGLVETDLKSWHQNHHDAIATRLIAALDDPSLRIQEKALAILVMMPNQPAVTEALAVRLADPGFFDRHSATLTRYFAPGGLGFPNAAAEEFAIRLITPPGLMVRLVALARKATGQLRTLTEDQHCAQVQFAAAVCPGEELIDLAVKALKTRGWIQPSPARDQLLVLVTPKRPEFAPELFGRLTKVGPLIALEQSAPTRLAVALKGVEIGQLKALGVAVNKAISERKAPEHPKAKSLEAALVNLYSDQLDVSSKDAILDVLIAVEDADQHSKGIAPLTKVCERIGQGQPDPQAVDLIRRKLQEIEDRHLGEEDVRWPRSRASLLRLSAASGEQL